MTWWTTPCSIVVRPVPNVTTPAISVSASNTVSLGSSPSVSGTSSRMETTATAGIVSPMLASAEPSARFRLVCSRLSRAARSASGPVRS